MPATLLASAPTIRRLSPGVVNKIAAGEVIERPASVVKELLENAVDAGAGRIDVHVEQGGLARIRITDDGCGIAADELSLAVASHATSKISTADDLFRVATLGFRGEALASIAEISRLSLTSRPPDADAGSILEVQGGSAGPPEPCGAAAGTTVEVRDLFFNTPVRRKFLRTTQTEMGHITEAFTRVALAWPRLHVSLSHGEKTLYDLPADRDLRGRVAAFFGADLAESLLPIESGDGDISISGFVADPQHSRGNNKMQYLFVGGRFIRDRALQHALGEAYRGLLLTGRYPICFLRLQMPPDAVDVNVHPTKTEVRFLDGGRLYGQFLGAIRKKFLATDLTARVGGGGGTDGQDSPAGLDESDAQRQRRELVEWARGQFSPPADRRAESDRQHDLELPAGERAPLELVPFDRGALAERTPFPPASGELAQANAKSSFPDQGAAARRGPDEPPRGGKALQIHNRYLVAEDEIGVVIIDQHALHERILYEQLRAKVLSGKSEVQRLLVPEPVPLSSAEAAAALEAAETLAQIGIEIEPFGGDTVLVTGYPAMLANVSPAELLRQAVEALTGAGRAPERRDVLDELLHMISCKAAIKAGDRLSPEEVTALIEQRHLCRDSHHCPHGRPTSLVFTREELDRRFKRT